ncbi:hypothetical protein QFZ51_002716 [Chitinophaga sp. W3I9]|uniref:hypothetical protein n=1 Tax=Chitinophaga sp. W3I9 TaxID=3373924 RepID=UPI003D1CFDC8
MEHNPIVKYQEFINKAILIDQTPLLTDLLDRNILDQQGQIFNQLEYKGKLSDGDFWGTDEIVKKRIEEATQAIDDLTTEIENNSIVDCRRIGKAMEDQVADLRKLKEMKARKRSIYQWLLIPHWLGTELISMGEVVFRAYGCSWYGVTSLLEHHCSKDAVLLELIEEIDKSDNILN